MFPTHNKNTHNRQNKHMELQRRTIEAHIISFTFVIYERHSASFFRNLGKFKETKIMEEIIIKIMNFIKIKYDPISVREILMRGMLPASIIINSEYTIPNIFDIFLCPNTSENAADIVMLYAPHANPIHKIYATNPVFVDTIFNPISPQS